MTMRFLLVLLTLLIPLTRPEILKYVVEEKLPINTLVVDFSRELKLTKNGSFILIDLLTNQRNFFNIDAQTGQLRTSNVLDRDEMCAKQQCSCNSCEILLQLIVQLSEKSMSKMIEIQLKDRNDHVPTFAPQSGRHLIHIKENVPLGYRIVLPSAIDPDEGSNSVQSYTLTGTDADDFDVDFTSLTSPFLIVRSSLDRQRLSSYLLTLIASDHGQQPKPLSSSIQLEIRILSMNESMPIFAQSVYSIDIREDATIGTSLLTITAINDDHTKISYEFLNESPFIIDSSSGKIRLNQFLDYEREKSYRLTVKAQSNAIPAYAMIFIRVIDVNDNAVTIRINTEGNITLEQKSSEQQTIFIEEHTPVGTNLAQIILNDLDSFANGNPYLQLRTTESPLPLIYKLIYQHLFQNTKVYSLIVNQNLDREVKGIYKNLQLIAYDSGTPTLHTQVDLTLNLTDINDCTPTITTNSTIYSINENNPIGLKIGKLSAIDCDIGKNGEFHFRLLNQTDVLIVDSQTGEITLNKSIDFEQLNVERRKNFTSIDLLFFIEVRDHGQPSLASQTMITLRIHDLNDNTPEFHRNQSFYWTINRSLLQPGVVLGRIAADDQDSGLAGLIQYTIRSFNPCLTLEMTLLGHVYLPSDSSIVSCGLNLYEFEIIASDSGLPQSRSTRQILKIQIDGNVTSRPSLPKLLPFDIQRTLVDVNTMGNVAFVLDFSTFNNQTYQPIIVFNNTHLSSTWNVNPNGEVRLLSHPFASSYILSLYIIDQYTQANATVQLQVKLCNSSIVNSCESARSTDNRMMLIYAISFASIISVIVIVLLSLIICLCCRKNPEKMHSTLSSNHRQSFLQYIDEFGSEKTENSTARLKSSSHSTIRDDDHDSACIIQGHSSSSNSSSSGVATRTDSWQPSPQLQQRVTPIPNYPYSSTYHYDLKLAEYLRQNQYPTCVHLNDPSAIPQSSSTDYGFSSLELSVTSSISTLPHHSIEMDCDQIPERALTLHSFVSSRECVV